MIEIKNLAERPTKDTMLEFVKSFDTEGMYDLENISDMLVWAIEQVKMQRGLIPRVSYEKPAPPTNNR